MPATVVDALEMVQIHHQAGDRLLVGPVLAEFHLEPFMEEPMVSQAREGVGDHLPGEPTVPGHHGVGSAAQEKSENGKEQTGSRKGENQKEQMIPQGPLEEHGEIVSRLGGKPKQQERDQGRPQAQKQADEGVKQYFFDRGPSQSVFSPGGWKSHPAIPEDAVNG